MIIHRLTYEIINKDHPYSEHPQAYVQQAVGEYELEQIKPELKAICLKEIQIGLLDRMPELMDDINTHLTMTPEEIENNNINSINELLLTDGEL